MSVELRDGGTYRARNGREFLVTANGNATSHGAPPSKYPFKIMLSEDYGYGVTANGKVFAHNRWDDEFDLVAEVETEITTLP